jgi:polyhydroxyalkanoate synthesis regulator phasin
MGGKSTGAAKGPDNNQRLAFLEAGVSALAIALTANGAAVGEGDPIELAIAIVKAGAKDRAEAAETISAMGAKIDALEKAGTEEAKAELEQLRARVAELEAGPTEPQGGDQALIAAAGRIAELERQLEAARTATGEEANDGAISTLKARVAELETEVGELETDVADAVSEKNRLANLLAAQGTSSTPPAVDQEPAAEPAPVERERAEGARDVGPDCGSLSGEEIAQAVAAEAEFEVAFSNGEFEIVDFSSPPIVVSPGQLERVNSAQFAVGPAVLIRGASAPEELHGAGLLLEGVQVGYCRFDPPIRIEPGQERKFDRALIFGG